jgi:hypothetical protein
MSAVTVELDLATDIANGNGITLAELARKHGMNPSTCFRWVCKGLPGSNGLRVRLAAVRRGKKWLTSAAAVKQFFGALPTSTQVAAAPPIRTPSQRERDTARAREPLQKQYRI